MVTHGMIGAGGKNGSYEISLIFDNKMKFTLVNTPETMINHKYGIRA